MDSSPNEIVAQNLNEIGSSYNFHVAPKLPKGKPASGGGNAREFRMQLINPSQDTADRFKSGIIDELKKRDEFKNIKFNELSPNSSKYSSVSFDYKNKPYDVVIARGANKGETYEKQVVGDLKKYFANAGISKEYSTLIKQLSAANKEFSKDEIVSVEQRTGSTKKEGVAIEKLGAVIGDIILTTSTGKKWYISLKDTRGDTFSSYSGAASLMSKDGVLDPNSAGAKFLEAFGVDLFLVQYGFLRRKSKDLPTTVSPLVRDMFKYIPKKKSPNTTQLKSIFERAWGMNYFYVRRISGGFQVYYIDRAKLNSLISNLRVEKIVYPSPQSKQITIVCSSNQARYTIEVRNSAGGEYPNDIKFKVSNMSV